MFDSLQISNTRERILVGLADLVLRGLVSPRSRRSPPRPGSVDRILLLRLERIGDLLMALRAIAQVRRLAPAAQIDLVVGSWNAGLARSIRNLDRVELLDVPWMAGKGRGASWPALLRRAWRWRRRRYDLGINFEGDIRSNLLLGISGATRRVGFDMRGGAPVLTDPVEFSETAHTATNQHNLVRRAFGSEIHSADDAEEDPESRLQIPRAAGARAEALLAPAGSTRMLIGIQASAGREVKQWDPVRFAAAGAALAREYGAVLVLTGTEDERQVTDQVLAAIPSDIRVIDLAHDDLDLVGFAAVLTRLDLFVSCDTGPMHLAAAVGTPTVSIFGPSLPSRYAPLSARSRIVRIDLPCSPCNQLRRPPSRCVGHIPDCLVGVEIPQVLSAARELLGPSGTER